MPRERQIEVEGGDWYGSPEQVRSSGRFRFLGLFGGVLAYGGIALLTLFPEQWEERTGLMFVTISLLIVGFLIFAFALYRRQVDRASFLERKELKAKEGVDEAIGELEDITDLRALIRINKSQMEQYEALTRRQANSSYRLSQGALGVGLALLTGGSIAALVTPESSSKAIVGALTAIGSVVAGYISNTYLRVYERTLVQLNYYFQQPLVTSYVLTAERLADKVRGTQRDEAQRRIIDQVLVAMTPTTDGQISGDEPASAGIVESVTNAFRRSGRKKKRDEQRKKSNGVPTIS